jgi:hypothetical protein
MLLRYVNIALASDRKIPIGGKVLGFYFISKGRKSFILSLNQLERQSTVENKFSIFKKNINYDSF